MWAATEARGSRRAAERSAHAAEISAHHQVTGAAAIIKIVDAKVMEATRRHPKDSHLSVQLTNAGLGPAQRVQIREFAETWGEAGWRHDFGRDMIDAIAPGEQIWTTIWLGNTQLTAPIAFMIRVTWEDSLGDREARLDGSVTVPWVEDEDEPAEPTEE